MKIPYYQIDTFTGSVFSGNPVGVCLLEEWLPDETLVAIAAENNLSETAFVVDEGGRRELRWFTPEVEVDLCGHATLATAFVLLDSVDRSSSAVSFETKSGCLTVRRSGDLPVMDLPSRGAQVYSSVADGLAAALGSDPEEVLASVRDLLVVLADEDTVRALRPDMAKLAGLEQMGIIVTAPGSGCDFVSRFFAPKVGVPEDPVTGSAHCTLTPYWAERLGKSELHALQVSERGGELFCEDRGERVSIGGRAVLHLEGMIKF